MTNEEDINLETSVIEPTARGLYLHMCLDKSNYVVQANNLVSGKQSLSLNGAKILRTAIMQIQRDDEELKPYIIKPKALAQILNVPTDNIYRVIDNLSNELIGSYAEARLEHGEKKKFKKINWVSYCEYDSNVGFAIKLNSDMKPYLLNLKDKYTQYTLENILAMNSVYAVRIFELLNEKIKLKMLPKEGMYVDMDLQYIRECCDCEDIYERFSQFKARVLDRAVEEINRVTLYQISYIVHYFYLLKHLLVIPLPYHHILLNYS